MSFKWPIRRVSLMLFSIMVCVQQGLAQDAFPIAEEGREMGNLKIKNYTYKDYKGGPWIKDMTQDEQGLVYFSSSEISAIVHTFDGSNFNTISVSNFNSRITSILVAKDTLWLGGGNTDLGFIARNEYGQFEGNNYISIKEMLPDSIKPYGVWSIKQLNDATYFLLQSKGLVQWRKGTLTFIPLPHVYRRMFVFSDKLFIPVRGQLYYLNDDHFKKLNWTGGMLWALLPFDEEYALAITMGSQQFGLFDGQNFTPIFQHLPRINLIFNALDIDGTYFALGTGDMGVIILNRQGQIVTVLNKKNGMLNNVVIHMLHTNDNSILLGTHNGLSQFTFPSPFSFFEIDNKANKVLRYKDTLFMGNRTGLYRLEKGTNKILNSEFVPVKNTNWWINSMLKTYDGFLIGTNNQGLYYYKDGSITLVDEATRKINIMDILNLKKAPELFLLKTFTSLDAMEYNDGKFHYMGEIKKIPGEFPMVEDRFGNIFFDNSAETYKLQIHSSYLESNNIKKALLENYFDLIKYPRNVVAGKVDDTIISMSYSGFGKGYHNLYYNHELDSFLPYTKFKNEFDNTKSFVAYKFVQDINGDVYTYDYDDVPLVYGDSTSNHSKTRRYHIKSLKQSNGNYVWDNDSYQDITEITGLEGSVYPDHNGVMWFHYWDGKIVRFDPKMIWKPKKEIKTYINMVKTITLDSVIYQGYSSTDKTLELAYENNSVSFGYSAISFIQPDSIYYRHQLKGFDRTWSNWSHDTQKDYTGLSPGTYTFKVQAVHPWLQTSALTEMTLAILPPWYLTWWAYLSYALLGGFIIYSIVKLRVRQLEKDKKHLEILVHDRTVQLEEQAEHLKEMDRIKTRFFANISHEFRTPLTLILGPLTKLYQGHDAGDTKGVFEIMLRSTKRLQRLINDLLDLSKLESGKFEIKASKVDMPRFIQLLMANYSSLAESKKIRFGFQGGLDHLDVYVDIDKMEQVIHNLLSNAFKFTDKKGKISISLNEVTEQDKAYAELLVEDSGIGIPQSQLQKIFDRFYQVETLGYSSEGTGIGLALVKELVELHQGSITVSSQEGEGTSFRVLLPLGKAHLSEEQIVEDQVEWQLQTSVETETPQVFPEAIPEGSKAKQPKVLMVEDNADMRTFIKLVLQGQYELFEANHGLAGLKKAIKLQPDLVISDVMMPKMDGMLLCKKLKTDWRTSHIPVVLLTAKADQDSKLEGLESRADDYITKPFNEQELLLIVRNRIQQREALKEKWGRIINLEPKEVCVTSSDEAFLNKLVDHVEANIDNENFGVNELTNTLAVSRTQLHRKLKALTDQSTTEFIRTFRLKRAYDLILKNAGSISEIAYKVGFSSPQYFNRAFKKQFGFAPGHIIKST